MSGVEWCCGAGHGKIAVLGQVEFQSLQGGWALLEIHIYICVRMLNTIHLSIVVFWVGLPWSPLKFRILITHFFSGRRLCWFEAWYIEGCWNWKKLWCILFLVADTLTGTAVGTVLQKGWLGGCYLFPVDWESGYWENNLKQKSKKLWAIQR